MEGAVNRWLNDILDTHGFDEESVKDRIHFMKRCSAARNISNKRILGKDYIDKFFVGSRSDGSGIILESDLDIMQVNNRVQCHEHVPPNLEDSRLVHFQVERDTAPDGYCFLRRIVNVQTESLSEVDFALEKQNNVDYLSSSKYIAKNEDAFSHCTGYPGRYTTYLERQGPSIPKYLAHPSMLDTGCNVDPTQIVDFVKALPCDCPSITENWAARDRNHDWPSQETVEYVASIPAHVVPTGKNESENADLQWRISYTQAEVHLIQSLNNTQMKVYVVLKQIAKHFLRPECPFVTSYVMKNILLWQSESIPSFDFQPDTLLERIKDSLIYLLECVKKGHLPSYMIPERNILLGKCQQSDYHNLKAKLDDLLKDGIKSAFQTARGSPCQWLEERCILLEVGLEMERSEMSYFSQSTDTRIAEYCEDQFFEARSSLNKPCMTLAAILKTKVNKLERFSIIRQLDCFSCPSCFATLETIPRSQMTRIQALETETYRIPVPTCYCFRGSFAYNSRNTDDLLSLALLAIVVVCSGLKDFILYIMETLGK